MADMNADVAAAEPSANAAPADAAPADAPPSAPAPAEDAVLPAAAGVEAVDDDDDDGLDDVMRELLSSLTAAAEAAARTALETAAASATLAAQMPDAIAQVVPEAVVKAIESSSGITIVSVDPTVAATAHGHGAASAAAAAFPWAGFFLGCVLAVAVLCAVEGALVYGWVLRPRFARVYPALRKPVQSTVRAIINTDTDEDAANRPAMAMAKRTVFPAWTHRKRRTRLRGS